MPLIIKQGDLLSRERSEINDKTTDVAKKIAKLAHGLTYNEFIQALQLACDSIESYPLISVPDQ